MKNRIIYFLIILFCPFIANSQIWDSLIIKTHPLRDFVALNPNIGFEKFLSKKMSVEFEFTYKNKDYNNYAKDMFGHYLNCSGYRMILGIKEYFGKNKQKPKAWYILAQFGYRNFIIPDYMKYEFPISFTQTFNIYKQNVDFDFLVGKGFLIYKHIFSEFNFGPGISYSYWYGKYTGAINTNNTNYLNKYYNNGWSPYFYFNWTIGYLISKKK